MTLNNPNWWDTGDEANAINRCPFWLRTDQKLLDVISNPHKQGVVTARADVDQPDWAGVDGTPACEAMPGTKGQACTGTDFVYLHNEVEKRVVSGSEVLYGPVGVESCSVPYPVGQPVLAMQDVEDFQHKKKSGPWPCLNWKDGRSGQCMIQPKFHFVPNGGCYRVHYTGDIGLFKRNVFSILNTELRPLEIGNQPRVRPSSTAPETTPKDQYAVLLDIRYVGVTVLPTSEIDTLQSLQCGRDERSDVIQNKGGRKCACVVLLEW